MYKSVNMCNLAAEQTSSWLMVDGWEGFQSYQRTAVVLDHFDHEINTVFGGIATQNGDMRPAKIMLLAGSDLIATMSEPGVWSDVDVSVSVLALSGVDKLFTFGSFSLITFWVDMDVSLWSARAQTWIRQRIVWRDGDTIFI
jgi:nicotinic acid mononucleotide adenylyltransferase